MYYFPVEISSRKGYVVRAENEVLYKYEVMEKKKLNTTTVTLTVGGTV
jgi:hypothetical protein